MPRSPEQEPQSPRSMRTGPGHHSATSWGLPSWAVLPPTHCARSYGVRSQRGTKKNRRAEKIPARRCTCHGRLLIGLGVLLLVGLLLVAVGRRRELPGLEVGEQRPDLLARDGVALNAAAAGDHQADRLAVEIDERAAAVGRLDHGVGLEDGGETNTADAQLAAEAVHVGP